MIRLSILISFAILLCVGTGSISAYADSNLIANYDGKEFYSSNKQSKAVLTKNGNSYKIFRQNRFLYEIRTAPPFRLAPKNIDFRKVKSAYDLGFLSGEIFLSNDSSTVVWLLLPTFYGHVVNYDMGAPALINEGLLQCPALAVFHHGKLLKVYDLKSLLVRPKLVFQSASHTTWIIPDENRILNGPAPALSQDERQFSFETTSFRRIVLNTRNAQLNQSKDLDVWSRSDLIVKGKFVPDRTQPNHFVVEQFSVLKGGTPQNQIAFFDPSKTYPQKESFFGVVGLRKAGASFVSTSTTSLFPVRSAPF